MWWAAWTWFRADWVHGFYICYAYFPAYGTIALLVVFGKNERGDLPPGEARATAKAIQVFESELRRQAEGQ